MRGGEDGLRGKTALVTGAARRIGRACALALARRGMNVVIHFHRSRTEAEKVRREIIRLGARAWTVQGDLSCPDSSEQVFADAVKAAGPVDLLLNNASIYGESRLASLAMRDLVRNLSINAIAPFLLARQLAAQRREGMVINFLDARLSRHDSGYAAYHVSKSLLLTLTRMMAVEFAPRVRVNAVAPGAILPPAGKGAAYMRKLAAANPLRRVGDLREITEAVLYLAGTRFVTGQVLFVDGGYHLRGKDEG